MESLSLDPLGVGALLGKPLLGAETGPCRSHLRLVLKNAADIAVSMYPSAEALQGSVESTYNQFLRFARAGSAAAAPNAPAESTDDLFPRFTRAYLANGTEAGLPVRGMD